jgi:hypothetical protein
MLVYRVMGYVLWLSQLAKQRPCLQEVWRFKALGKPTVDRPVHIDCFFDLRPSRHKGGLEHAGAQFKRLRALIDGNVDAAGKRSDIVFGRVLGATRRF